MAKSKEVISELSDLLTKMQFRGFVVLVSVVRVYLLVRRRRVSTIASKVKKIKLMADGFCRMKWYSAWREWGMAG